MNVRHFSTRCSVLFPHLIMRSHSAETLTHFSYTYFLLPDFHPSLSKRIMQHLNREQPPRPPRAHHLGPPHASHVPLRQGARRRAPPFQSSSLPPPPSTSIHHICPPASIKSPQRQQTPKKRKGPKQGEKHTATTMHNSADQRTVFCPGSGLSSPGLSYKHTLFSGGTTAQRLGDGTGVWCYLKQYNLVPSMAPWSPADPVC